LLWLLAVKKKKLQHLHQHQQLKLLQLHQLLQQLTLSQLTLLLQLQQLMLSQLTLLLQLQQLMLSQLTLLLQLQQLTLSQLTQHQQNNQLIIGKADRWSAFFMPARFAAYLPSLTPFPHCLPDSIQPHALSGDGNPVEPLFLASDHDFGRMRIQCAA
jgi:hypothetical protein